MTNDTAAPRPARALQISRDGIRMVRFPDPGRPKACFVEFEDRGSLEEALRANGEARAQPQPPAALH